MVAISQSSRSVSRPPSNACHREPTRSVIGQCAVASSLDPDSFDRLESGVRGRNWGLLARLFRPVHTDRSRLRLSAGFDSRYGRVRRIGVCPAVADELVGRPGRVGRSSRCRPPRPHTLRFWFTVLKSVNECRRPLQNSSGCLEIRIRTGRPDARVTTGHLERDRYATADHRLHCADPVRTAARFDRSLAQRRQRRQEFDFRRTRSRRPAT